MQNVNILPLDVTVGLIFILLIFYYTKNGMHNEFKNFFVLQACFTLTGVIMLFVNAFLYKDLNIFVSLLYPLRYVCYLSLLSLGPFFKKDILIKKVITFSGLIFLIAGFVQFVQFNNLKPLFHLGWDDHLYRLFSTLLDPNYAGVLYLVYLFVFVQIAYGRRVSEAYRYIVYSFFTVLAIYLTYSRTALIGLLIGIITVAHRIKKFMIVLPAMVFLTFLLLIVSDVGVEGLNPFRTQSTIGRVISVKEAVLIIKESNYLGVGFNAFRYAQVRYDTRNEVGAAKSNSDAGTDNSFLFAAATTGLVGIVFFVASYIALFKVLVREKAEILAASLLISLFVASLFINVLFYTPILAVTFIVFAVRKNLI